MKLQRFILYFVFVRVRYFIYQYVRLTFWSTFEQLCKVAELIFR